MTLGDLGICTPPEIALEIPFHDGEASQLLLPRSISLLLDQVTQYNQKIPIPVSSGDRSGLRKPIKEKYQH